MNLEEEKRSLKILHLALCFGALLLIILLHFFLKNIDLSTTSNPLSMIEMLAICLASINLVLANFLFKRKTESIASGKLASENIAQWRAAYILKWALLEGAILFNAQIYFFIGSNAILAIVALLLLLLLYISKPNLS